MKYQKKRMLFISMLIVIAFLLPPECVKAEEIGVESSVEVVDASEEEDDSGGSWLVKLGKLLLDIPATIVAFIMGFSGVTGAIKGLLQVIFPFLPGMVINIFIVMMYFMVALAVWKLIK